MNGIGWLYGHGACVVRRCGPPIRHRHSAWKCLMRPSRQFRPSLVASLEPRVALSHAGAVVAHSARAAASSQTSYTLRGTYTTTVDSGVDTAHATLQLTGSAQAQTVGTVSVSGSLSNSIV